VLPFIRHWDSLFSIVTRLRDEGTGVQIPSRIRDLSLLQNVLTGSGAHPASYSVGKGSLFPRGYSGRDLRLTTYLYLVPRLEMGGA
jgi:hypothetical protein